MTPPLANRSTRDRNNSFYVAGPPTAANYVTEPHGGCVTGAVTDVDGRPTHICMNSANDYYCTRGNDGWKQCQQHKGKYDKLFVRTELYTAPTSIAVHGTAVVVPTTGGRYRSFDRAPVSAQGFDVTFEAMAQRDVHVAFMCTQQESAVDAWEVVFGGWSNTKSVIRHGTGASLGSQCAAWGHVFFFRNPLYLVQHWSDCQSPQRETMVLPDGPCHGAVLLVPPNALG